MTTTDPTTQASETEPRRSTVTLSEALAFLDPENPDHWNKDGSPKMAVLEDLTGGNLTRADAEKDPNYLTRDLARQAKADAPPAPLDAPAEAEQGDPPRRRRSRAGRG